VSQVLVVSAKDDWSAIQVVDRLAHRGVSYTWLDPADFPQRMGLSASFDRSWRVRVGTPAGWEDLSEVTAVFYWRPSDFDIPAGMSGPERRFARAQARVGLGGVLASLPVKWINHPSALADAEYKPRQFATANVAGLAMPRTLITNDPGAVRAFAAEVGDIIVKPLAEPILNEAGTQTLVWTRRLTAADLDDLSGVESTAHLFQAWVPKSHEVRVIAIGERLFPVAIRAGSPAAAVDWRSDYDALTYRLVECPNDVSAGISAYLMCAGLVYGAFDFVVTPAHEWILLECNGAGQWGWLAEELDLPIAQAIADELSGVRT
jgi:ATP-grasp ribosomal peptide maturase